MAAADPPDPKSGLAEPQSIHQLIDFLATSPSLDCTEGTFRDRGLRCFVGCDREGSLVLRRLGDCSEQRIRLFAKAPYDLQCEAGLVFEPGGFAILRGCVTLRYRYCGVSLLDKEPPAGEEPGS